MTYLVQPGSQEDLEVVFRDKDGNKEDVYALTFEVHDPDDVLQTSGAATWESEGTYLVKWTVPGGATGGSTYKVTLIITPSVNATPKRLSYTLQIGSVLA